MVDDNEGLLREVEEELRRERLTAIWNQYGTLILAGVALLVAGVGGWKYWQNQQIAAAQTAGISYERATQSLANSKTDEALTKLKEITAEGPGGYQTLAQLQIAGAHLKKGEKDKALAAFDAIAGDAEADATLRDYATLQAVALNIGDADLSEVQNRLNRLITGSSDWKSSARELVALAAFREKKFDVAKTNLRAIVADPSAAEGMIKRANTLLASIAAKEVAAKGSAEKADAGAAETGTATAETESKTSAETTDEPENKNVKSEKKD